jgi:thiamine pyrophosphate-dependent acetolactate synthase large subunit-like protein
MRRAFTMLRSGRPGPVILAIPNAPAKYDETADPYRAVKGWKSAPDPADVRAAVDQLLGAGNPLIYAGEGVIYAGAAEDLKALAELVNVPVITTLKAKGVFPENHPLFVGVRGDQVAYYLNKSDLILAVGSSLSPLRFSDAIPDAAKKTIIHCNVDELHINKMYPTAHAVTGEAGLGYMLGNLEVLLREKLGITVVHISNGGFAGYGPGFWGPGHDPFTHQVMGPEEVDMSKVIGALGFHTERVSEPAEVIPALRRALDVNTSGRPAYIEFICCQYPVYGQWVGRSAE